MRASDKVQRNKRRNDPTMIAQRQAAIYAVMANKGNAGEVTDAVGQREFCTPHKKGQGVQRPAREGRALGLMLPTGRATPRPILLGEGLAPPNASFAYGSHSSEGDSSCRACEEATFEPTLHARREGLVAGRRRPFALRAPLGAKQTQTASVTG